MAKSAFGDFILTPSGHPEAPQDAAVRLSDRFFVVLGVPFGAMDQFLVDFWVPPGHIVWMVGSSVVVLLSCLHAVLLSYTLSAKIKFKF